MVVLLLRLLLLLGDKADDIITDHGILGQPWNFAEIVLT
jgi:hypothetical protein